MRKSRLSLTLPQDVSREAGHGSPRDLDVDPVPAGGIARLHDPALPERRLAGGKDSLAYEGSPTARAVKRLPEVRVWGLCQSPSGSPAAGRAGTRPDASRPTLYAFSTE